MRVAVIKESSCVACGACAGVCNAIFVAEGVCPFVDPQLCRGCGRCEALCLQDAIRMVEHPASDA